MFDDQLPAGNGGGQAPPNLPTVEPQDMLAGTDPAPQAPAAPIAPPAPAAPTALDAGVLTPKGPTPPAAPEPADPFGQIDSAPAPRPQMMQHEMPASPAQASHAGMADLSAMNADAMGNQPIGGQQQAASYAVKGPSLSRGIMTVIIVAIVLLIVGGGAWWVYAAFVKDGSSDGSFQQPPVIDPGFDSGELDSFDDLDDSFVPSEEALSDTDVGDEIRPGVADDAGEDADDRLLFGEPIDSDGDGLDDVREADLRTDPANWDTDGDELSDGDEVIIWKTDPLNEDSDGDTYLDGAEVKSGYNPAGPGRFFEVPRDEPGDVEPTAPTGDSDVGVFEPAAEADNPQLRATVGFVGACTDAQYEEAATTVLAGLLEQEIAGTYVITESTFTDAGVGAQIRGLLIEDGCLLQ